jgi:poly(A) polymerase
MVPPWMSEATVRRLLSALNGAGIASRFVGGCVRNWLIERPIDDIDVAVDKPPERVTHALEAAGIKVVPTGLSHGTVTAVIEQRPIEITTLRRDVETDGRRAIVAFTDDWRTDAARRDFTFNALYADADGTIYDYFNGRADLSAGRVRFIGNPDQRIAEDRLRVLRFFRFHAWFGRPPLDGPGFDACRRNAVGLRGLSGERVRKELLRLLAAPAPAEALEAMVEAGALDHWLPEYAGPAQLVGLIAREDRPDPLRRLAAVLASTADATAIGKRLKLSTQETLRLQVMLEPLPDNARNFRALLYRLGPTLFVDRLLLAGEALGDWRAGLDLARSWMPPVLPVSGADALRLGLKPGPAVGKLLEAVERWWIDGGFSADRAACLAELERRARDQAP